VLREKSFKKYPETIGKDGKSKGTQV